MLKLATVFSGIGAIEHALDRMKIPHEIVFACDNGDVDIFDRKIPVDFEEISENLGMAEKQIDEIIKESQVDAIYEEQLSSMKKATRSKYSEVETLLSSLYDEGVVEVTRRLVGEILKGTLNNNRKKAYTALIVGLKNENKDNQMLYVCKSGQKISNDFKRHYAMSKLDSESISPTDGIEWESIRKEVKKLWNFYSEEDVAEIIRKTQDLVQRTNQLFEKMTSLSILNKLETMETPEAKQEYVENLYRGQDRRNKVKQSYLANYDLNPKNFFWNIQFLDGKPYRGKVDLFVGGSPCQSFSLAGKQRGLDDTRGTLFYEYARLIDEIQPKVFIYENVKALTFHDHGKTWAKMQQVFEELGYDYSWKILNARDFGIPQNRERVFVVGFRKDLRLKGKFHFPTPIPLRNSMKDFLEDSVPGGYFISEKGLDFVLDPTRMRKRYTQVDGEIQLCQTKNQEANLNGDFVFVSEEEAREKGLENLEKYFLSGKVEKYVLDDTVKFNRKPETDREVARTLKATMGKMHRASQDNYVHTNGRLRRLTPRECLRLMGFTDDWKIVVSDSAMYQQTGNSIVVNVLMAIMNEILKVCPEIAK